MVSSCLFTDSTARRFSCFVLPGFNQRSCEWNGLKEPSRDAGWKHAGRRGPGPLEEMSGSDVRFQSGRSTACSSACGWLAAAATTRSRFSPERAGPPSPCRCCTGRCRTGRSRCAAPASPAHTHTHTHTHADMPGLVNNPSQVCKSKEVLLVLLTLPEGNWDVWWLEENHPHF